MLGFFLLVRRFIISSVRFGSCSLFVLVLGFGAFVRLKGINELRTVRNCLLFFLWLGFQGIHVWHCRSP